MARLTRFLAIGVLFLGVVAVVVGAVFVSQGVTKGNEVKDILRSEKVTLGIDKDAAAAGDVVDSQSEAEAAAATLKEHRTGIAPTYSDLLNGGRFNPADPKQLTWSQAVNLENALGISALALGVTTATIANGVFMVIIGLALGAIGVVLWIFNKTNGRTADQPKQVTA